MRADAPNGSFLSGKLYGGRDWPLMFERTTPQAGVSQVEKGNERTPEMAVAT